MNLQQVAITTFVLFQPTWSVENSRQLIQRLQPTHVIVHRQEPYEAYYLFSEQETLTLLAQAAGISSAEQALHLNEQTPIPALEGETDVEQAPDQCVILENHSLIGFFDASLPPQSISTQRSDRQESGVTTSDVSLIAELPEATVQVQKLFSLLVSLSALPVPQSKDSFSLSLPEGSTVDILIRPSEGIVVEEGHGNGVLIVPKEDETLPLQFKLRGTSIGLGQIRVDAFHKGLPLGKLKVHVVIQEGPTHTQTFFSQQQPLEPVRLQYPDLSLLIEEHAGSKTAFTFRITASDPAMELYLKQFGPTSLQTDPQYYFQDFFRDIETLSLTSNSEQMIATRLATKGMNLFTTLLPADLQEVLWSLRDRIRSVQVQSDEPWIPWELCKLCGRENGRMVEGPFLCEAFAITRWIPGISIKPRLSLNNIAVVVPKDSGLAHVTAERNYLLSLRTRKRNVRAVSATFLDLYEAFAAGEYDAWHFSGHGSFQIANSDRSEMHLENGETLTPENLRGMAENLGIPKPLVFLNACQIGRMSMALTGIGGWANQFLKVGAGAFLGAYWSINDSTASAFARAFYRRLLGGIPLGEAVQQARIEIKSTSDPTWLAYTVFADPLATVQKEPSSEE